MEGLIGLIGVILGFGLGAGYQEYRDWARRKRLCSELRNELTANLYSIPQKKATIQSIISAMSEQKVLPGTSVPFCTAIFGHHYPECSPFFSQKERNLLQVVYSTLRTVDATLAEFEPAVTGASSEHAENRVLIAFEHKLKDLISALEEQERLIQSFMDRTPVDVFHMDMDYHDLKMARITKG